MKKGYRFEFWRDNDWRYLTITADSVTEALSKFTIWRGDEDTENIQSIVRVK